MTFQKKCSSSYILLIGEFIIWSFLLPLLLEILGNMCIAIVSFPGSDVINFEINHIFLIKPFFYMAKIRTKRALKVKWKAFFIIFKGLSVAKNCFRPEKALLSIPYLWYNLSPTLFFRFSLFLEEFQHSRVISGGRGDASLSLFENRKNCSILEQKALIVSIFGLNFPFKM